MVYTKLIKEPEFLCSKFKKAVFNKYIKQNSRQLYLIK